MNILSISLIILFLIAFCFVVFLRILFVMAFYPCKNGNDIIRQIPNTEQYAPIKGEMLRLIDKLEKIPCEEINITSHDKLKLHGRFYKREREGIIDIDFHGYKGHALRDYCGGSLINEMNGISSILITQRSHDKSDGNAITFGINERHDVITWINYVLDRFGKDTKIILSGVSMGAATVLMASDMNLPKNVVGIVADCPYSSPKEIIKKVMRDKKYPDNFLYPFVKLSAKLFAKINLDETSAVDAVKNTSIPILIIHGDKDRYVPYHMGKEIFDNCSSQNKKMLTVKNAGHGICYFVETDNYYNTVTAFVEGCLRE